MKCFQDSVAIVESTQKGSSLLPEVMDSSAASYSIIECELASCSCCRMETQVALVRACWTELFVLGMAQCSQILSLPSILSSIINHLHNSVAQDKISAHRVKLVLFCFFYPIALLVLL